jgi:hypothetical protein
MMMWEEHVTCMTENRNAYKALVRKSKGSPCYRWDSSIKMVIYDKGIVNTVINLSVP